MIRAATVVSVLCLHASSLSGAALSDALAVSIPKLSRPPQISEFLSGTPVSGYATVNDFRQRQPKDGDPATQPTQAYLGYDDHSLYVVFVCTDQPRLVRAHMSARESVSGDDLVGVALDTFHDHRRAYMFYSNPLGVQLDGISSEGQSDDYDFDTTWSSEGKLTPFGYVVRFAIPFRSLRTGRGGDGRWGIALTRVIRRNTEYATWPRITDKIEAYIPQFAVANTPERAASNHNVVLIPYGFFAQQRFLADTAPFMRSQREVRGGLDAKVVLKDRFTLDATVNPDFSQVESDEPQVTVNQRYELYYPEKRPFFLENASFFQTPELLFFSRRIADPELGVRLTGKAGPWVIGLLGIDDRAPVRLGISETPAHIGVLRVQRELGGGSSAGILITSRRDGLRTNEIAAGDVRWKISSNWVFSGQAIRSKSDDSGDKKTGTAWFGDMRYVGRNFQYSTTYRDRSPDFVTDLGYIPRVDIRAVSTDASYQWRPEEGRLMAFGPGIKLIASYDHAGLLQDWAASTPFTLSFRGPTTVSAAHTESFERYQNFGFRKRFNSVFVSTDKWKWLGITAYAGSGQDINYYPAAGLRPTSADSVEGRFEVTLRPNSRMRIDESYYYTRLASQGRAILTDHLARARVAYQFTHSISARVILDYEGLLADPGLSGIDPSKRLGTDILVTYMATPGTAVYAGYSDRRENLLWPGGFDSIPTRGGSPTFASGRMLFVKLSYPLRI